MQLTGIATRGSLPTCYQISMSSQFAGLSPHCHRVSPSHLVAATGASRQVSTISCLNSLSVKHMPHSFDLRRQKKHFEPSGNRVPNWQTSASIERSSAFSFLCSRSSSSCVGQSSLGLRSRLQKSNVRVKAGRGIILNDQLCGWPQQMWTTRREAKCDCDPRCGYRATSWTPGVSLHCQAENTLVAGGGWVMENRHQAGASGSVRMRACAGNDDAQQNGWQVISVTEPQIIDGTVEIEGADNNVLDRLKQGFVKFRREKFDKERDLFNRLAEKQEPKVMIIACSDSRVCPTLIMGLEPGEVFVVRNVANLVPPWEAEGFYHGTSAALEFAVTGLQVAHIIVVGHSSCGGIRALLSRAPDQPPSSDFINKWVQIGQKAYDRTKELMGDQPVEEQCRFCEKEAIKVSLSNLLTFPWIKQRFNGAQLQLHGMYYDFLDGTLSTWEVRKDSEMVAEEPVVTLVG